MGSSTDNFLKTLAGMECKVATLVDGDMIVLLIRLSETVISFSRGNVVLVLPDINNKNWLLSVLSQSFIGSTIDAASYNFLIANAVLKRHFLIYRCRLQVETGWRYFDHLALVSLL